MFGESSSQLNAQSRASVWRRPLANFNVAASPLFLELEHTTRMYFYLNASVMTMYLIK